MLEVLGDRRMHELRTEHAEPRVELVAAAVGQHAELARARHAGRDVAGALAVAHELALQVARRSAPAIRPHARRDRHEPRDAFGMPRRERDADQAAQARADVGHRARAADAIEPRREQIGEPERRQWRGDFTRPVARPREREHRRALDELAQRRPPRIDVGRAERKRRCRDATDDHDDRRLAERRADRVADELDVAERVPLDRERRTMDDEPRGRYRGHVSVILEQGQGGVKATRRRSWCRTATMIRMAESLAHSPTLAASTGEGEPLVPGTLAGEYVVERFVGAGASGEVYAGHHPVLGKKVAIKVLRAELATSAEAVERFTREARAVNAVEHAGVVDVFAHGRLADGRLYLVMSFVAGTTLRAKLVETGAMPVDEAIALLEPIADALDAAHAKGI